MAEVAPAALPARSAKKRVYKPRSGLSVGELIVRTVAASKERGGVSLAALKKVLAAGGYDVEKNRSRIKMVVKNLVAKGTLVQVRGTGASGSFRMSKKVDDKPKKTAKKTAPKSKKPVAKKPAAAKKPKAAAKKPVAAKKSPKKAKKPAKKTAVKSLKKTKSPKKAVKKTAAKKTPAARKAPAKKVVKPKAKKAAPKKK